MSEQRLAPTRPVPAPIGELQVVHLFEHGPMPTGVTVSRDGRIFVCFPKWGDDVPATVAEIRDGVVVEYPDAEWNSAATRGSAKGFVSVQSVVVDPLDRLWVVDTGSPRFKRTKGDGPKLVCVDLGTDQVTRVITFSDDVVLPTSYLNDVRFDLRFGLDGVAYLTDSAEQGPNGIIVVDLGSGSSRRRLHDHPSTRALLPPDLRIVVEGRDLLRRDKRGATAPVAIGADGIAIAADGTRLFYSPLASRRLWSVDARLLADPVARDEDVAASVVDEGDKGGVGDGLETDDQGRVYVTDAEHNAVHRRQPDGRWETLVADDRLLWPDTLSLAGDGHLYLTANQLHRQAEYRGGTDERVFPYLLLRTPVDAGPVRLC